MTRLHSKLIKQANRLRSWFACFFLFVATVCPSWAMAQVPQTAADQSSKQQAEDAEDRVAGSISRLGVLEDKDVSESSGLARAAVADCFWTINDSGNPAKLFLFGGKGQKLAQITLANASNRDWESLASFTLNGQHWGLVADVGDNRRLKTVQRLYFFRDPTDQILGAKSKKEFEKLKSVEALPVEFLYQSNSPGRSVGKLVEPIRQDCEAVAVDPLTHDIWFVEKVLFNRDRKVVPGVYVLPMPKVQLARHAREPRGSADGNGSRSEVSIKLAAQRVGSFPVRYVTGMSFSPDGKKLIIRNYLTAHLYIRPDGKTWRQTIVDQKPITVTLPFQRQGEAICFTADSQSVIVTSEGRRRPVWKVDLQVYIQANGASTELDLPAR